jgi:Zn-dependent peptidase ImmA (M78 family)
MLDSAAWLHFCETDRAQLLARCSTPAARPADVLDEIIEEVLGLSLVIGPMTTPHLGQFNHDRSCIFINSRMADLVRPNTFIEGLTNSTKAHELAHLRIPQHEHDVRAARRRGEPLSPELEALHEAQADSYAGIFLVPTLALWAMPAVSRLLDAQSQSAVLPSDELWRVVANLARSFAVTGSLMARRLEHLGLVEKYSDRQLRYRRCL